MEAQLINIETKHNEQSTAVQAHLSLMQATIQRMAANSGSCKTWCITIVSAILVVVSDKGKPNYALIAGIPIIMFLALDAYYLVLERSFRSSYNSFIKKLHDGGITPSDLYVVTPSGPVFKSFGSSLSSFSIWPFYLTLAGMVLLIRFLLPTYVP